MFCSAVYCQPTFELLERITMIRSPTSTGTAFGIEVDGREYWITAKHILTGAKHPPYGTIPQSSMNLQLVNPGGNGQQWVSIPFKILDPGKDLDIAILVPPSLVSGSKLRAARVSGNGLMPGGTCQFLGFPYRLGAWKAKFADGGETWMPYVKHCGISAILATDDLLVLDGINNQGFSGGPVYMGTGLNLQIIGVVSGYYTEPWEVVPSQVRRLQRPAQTKQQHVKANMGFMVATNIEVALKAIRANPIGPISPHAQ
jgi:hypothetical protein